MLFRSETETLHEGIVRMATEKYNRAVMELRATHNRELGRAHVAFDREVMRSTEKFERLCMACEREYRAFIEAHRTPVKQRNTTYVNGKSPLAVVDAVCSGD